ncbi:MAG: rod shape-determining protein MreC [Armatimonadota bacterium]|nr:rod shape-determining protein MreC [Armatimonadota bacterium]MCX7777421.1 rod shape-determining protein MreC [Armatimonadota bacterium]MDW8025090.1 rod shape-determining protein MreC [Armatimonadota bacterium]
MEPAMPRRRLSRFFLLGGIIGAALSLMVWLRPSAPTYVTKVEQIGVLLMTPISMVTERVCYVAGKMASVFRLFHEVEQLERENRQLKRRLVELESENRQLRRYMTENYRLRRLLQLEPKLPQTHTVAEVIAISPSNWVASAVLNRGIKDGVSAGDVVVACDGLVGQVARVSQSSCVVLFITDKRCGVGVRVKRNGAVGFLRGCGNGKCLVRLLDSEGDLRIGDELVTSGLGEVYPAGIPIGRVVSIHQFEASQLLEGIVEPFIKFGGLQEVFIIPQGQGVKW